MTQDLDPKLVELRDRLLAQQLFWMGKTNVFDEKFEEILSQMDEEAPELNEYTEKSIEEDLWVMEWCSRLYPLLEKIGGKLE